MGIKVKTHENSQCSLLYHLKSGYMPAVAWVHTPRGNLHPGVRRLLKHDCVPETPGDLAKMQIRIQYVRVGPEILCFWQGPRRCLFCWSTDPGWCNKGTWGVQLPIVGVGQECLQKHSSKSSWEMQHETQRPCLKIQAKASHQRKTQRAISPFLPNIAFTLYLLYTLRTFGISVYCFTHLPTSSLMQIPEPGKPLLVGASSEIMLVMLAGWVRLLLGGRGQGSAFWHLRVFPFSDLLPYSDRTTRHLLTHHGFMHSCPVFPGGHSSRRRQCGVTGRGVEWDCPSGTHTHGGHGGLLTKCHVREVGFVSGTLLLVAWMGHPYAHFLEGKIGSR